MLLAFILPVFSSFNTQAQSDQEVPTFEEAQQLYDVKEYDASLKLIQEMTEEPEVRNDWPLLVNLNLLAGKNYNRKKDYPQRLAAAQKALDITQKHLPAADSLLPIVLREKGDSFIRLSQFDSSVYYLERARERFLEMQNWNQASSCGVGIGSALYRKKDYYAADRALSEARDLMQEKLDPLPSLYGTVLNLLSAVYRGTGDYEKALQNSLNAVRFHEQNSSANQRLTFAYNNLGTAYFNRADYDKAEEILLLAEISANNGETPDYRSLSNIYNNLMLVLTRKQQYRRAIGYGAQRQLLISKNQITLSPANSVNFHNNLALIFLETEEPSITKRYLDKAYLLDTGRLQTISNLGYYYFRLEKMDSASMFIKKAIDKFGDSRSQDLSKLYRYLGSATTALGDRDQGLRYFNKSIQLLVPDFEATTAYEVPALTEIRSKRELLRTLVKKSEQLLLTGASSSDVNKTLLTAVALTDSLYQDYLAEGSRLFLKSQAMPLYEMTIKVLMAQYQSTSDMTLGSQLFDLFEKGKSNRLTDLLNVKNANLTAGVPTALVKEEGTLQIDLAFYESESYKARLKEDSLKTALYNGYRLEKINELDKLRENLQANYPKYYKARHGLDKLNLAEVQRKLRDSDEVLVEYFVGESSVFVMAITANEFVVREVPQHMKSLRSLVVQFISTVNNPTLLQSDQQLAFQRLNMRGQALYKELLEPVLKDLRETPKALYIVPDGFLNYLPFEALLTESSSNSPDFIGLPYLIKEYPVRYGYSASLPTAKARKNWSRPKVLGMAPFSEENLPDSGNEIEEIGNHFSASLLQGSTGTKAEFRNRANDYQVIHLATHGTIDDQNPAQSYLSFAPDSTESKLHVYELENMDLNAKLAILSACETGNGNFRAGEGVMSLARGFTYAGVPSILMSLWKVDDRSGTDLISGFYKGLSAEVNKAQALQAAKLNYLENADQLHAHPYFWSQFVLVGDPAPIKSIGIWQLWVTLVALVLLVSLGLARRRAQRK